MASWALSSEAVAFEYSFTWLTPGQDWPTYPWFMKCKSFASESWKFGSKRSLKWTRWVSGFIREGIWGSETVWLVLWFLALLLFPLEQLEGTTSICLWYKVAIFKSCPWPNQMLICLTSYCRSSAELHSWIKTKFPVSNWLSHLRSTLQSKGNFLKIFWKLRYFLSGITERWIRYQH